MKVAIVSILFILSNAASSLAAPRVQFSRQVLPLLKRECMVCHSGPAAPNGYSMETAERLVAGGRHGAAVLPGKGGQSNMVRYLLGQLQPQMPPGKPLPLDTIALLRRWIDEGARIDSMTVPAPAAASAAGSPRPSVPPSPRLPLAAAPVTALAYAPDGKLLAAGGYQVVRLIDPSTGMVTRTLAGPADQVLSLAWSPDGKRLAAGGGLAAAFGEVCLWNTATWGKPRIVRHHADTIYGIAWRPGAPELATASLDKTVAIWNAATFTVTRTLKDHADAVFCVAYSPDGKWLATGSADRSVKLYQTPGDSRPPTAAAARAPSTASVTGAARPAPEATMRPVAALPHGDAVTALAFGPKSDLLVTACMDKQVRVWPVKAGSMDNPLRSHGEGEAVNAVAFSADGSLFVWGAANHKVRIWNGDVSSQSHEMDDPTDWVYAVAASPDGKTIAAGAGDGKLYFWNQADGKLLRAQLLGASSTVVAAHPSAGKR